MLYSDLEYLSVPLPEDILHARECGDFDLALRLTEKRIGSGRLPEAMAKRLELEAHILGRMREEYTVTEEAALEELREGIGDLTEEDFEELLDDRELDWAYVKGTRHIHRRAIANFYKTHDDLACRAFERGKLDSPGGPMRMRGKVIEEMKAKGEASVRFRIRSEMTIRPEENAEPPRPVRIWLPIPCEYAQNRNVRILTVSHPDSAHVDSPQAAQRTVCMDGTDDQKFSVEYEYETHMKYICPEEKKAAAEQPSFFTEEQPPHIRFTPFLRALCREIVGQESNPLTRARLIYRYITHNIRYSFMRAYFTIPMITEYAAADLRGDCGVQALLFITLCRIAGIPARWQSGLDVEPGAIGSHDWAQFYVAPYGWMFTDCSFGGSAVRRGMKDWEEFYFCNLDPMRMAANSAFQQDFEVAPKYPRHDPYDNQTGEAEYAEGPVPRGQLTTEHTLVSVSGMDCLKQDREPAH